MNMRDSMFKFKLKVMLHWDLGSFRFQARVLTRNGGLAFYLLSIWNHKIKMCPYL